MRIKADFRVRVHTGGNAKDRSKAPEASGKA